MTERISAHRTLPAAPEAIFEVLTDPDGTTVTSYCDWSAAAAEWKPSFPVIDEKALRASLGLLEQAAPGAGGGHPRRW